MSSQVEAGRRLREEFTTTFELGGVRDSRASHERVGRLVLGKAFALLDAHQPSGGDWTLLIRCEPDRVEEIAGELKVYYYEYRGPTFFCGSSIRSVFETPEDEREGRPTDRYLRHARGECSCRK